MKASETIEGWSNHETWQVNIVIANDQRLHDGVLLLAERAARGHSHAEAVKKLGDDIADTFNAASPKVRVRDAVDEFWEDQLQAISDAIDWDEIAEEWLAKAKENT